MDVNARISIISSSGSSTNSGDFTHDLSGQEMLLLRQLQSNLYLLESWKDSLSSANKVTEDDCSLLAEIPQSLYFLPRVQKERLLEFIYEQVRTATSSLKVNLCQESLLSRYFSSHAFTEFHLDGIFKYGDDNTLPLEVMLLIWVAILSSSVKVTPSDIFKCRTVRRLSLKYNYLDRIPADIGQMANLEFLALTNNKLQNKSLPYALTFCCRLKTLMLDNNLLDALPGFLLKMSSLETVHRHGNHNYFKSTFMWYHTDVNERILAVPGSVEYPPPSQRRPRSLQFWCAKSVIGSKLNFFAIRSIAPALRDYIASIYGQFNVCGCCNKAKLSDQSGFKVITFKNPYLGNTCVPFQHWACSLSCAMALEIPAREEQIAAARELDRQYDSYVRECQRQYHSSGSTMSSPSTLLCTSSRQHRRSMRQFNLLTVHDSEESSLSQPEEAERQSSEVSQSSTNSCFPGCRLLCCVS